ncbi:hypothetical protein [Nocardia arthritidis]|uniref:Uncharacterized protein n=1 Tax=Nocardia arthritidis TaxID=228602 RepID=A0A6G9YJK3_9NOCA|nr:hypothetical protein [Nocardia arthritidis]QIS13340.1 hypothetical protein F5544_27430 [Nocardia arthritidis]
MAVTIEDLEKRLFAAEIALRIAKKVDEASDDPEFSQGQRDDIGDIRMRVRDLQRRVGEYRFTISRLQSAQEEANRDAWDIKQGMTRLERGLQAIVEHFGIVIAADDE